jgi:tripartite-type tricarboxylate transporter receptor subunit TctC
MSARLLAPYAVKKLGVPVNVVNVSGASGVTGMLQALKATPDGYSLLYDGNSVSSMMFGTRTDLPLKLEDRIFINRTTTDNWYFFCNIKTGWKTKMRYSSFDRSPRNSNGAAACGGVHVS